LNPEDRTVLTLAGNLTLQPDYQDGQSISASFNHPYGIASNARQNLYISDFGNSINRKINGSRYVSTYAGVRSDSLRFSSTLSTIFDKPTAIAIDARENLFFFNQGTSQTFKITQASVDSISEPTIEQFLNLSSSSSQNIDIAVDENNYLWVIESLEEVEFQSIQVVSI
jgi:hypothetical protein